MLANIQNRLSYRGHWDPNQFTVMLDGLKVGTIEQLRCALVSQLVQPWRIVLHAELYGSEVDGREYHTLQGAAIALVETLSSRNLLTITE
jgi:hypothetical protein